MPVLIIYLLKANAALILFYAAYRFGLRHLTFYYLNRAFLVFGLIFSAIYPFIKYSSPVVSHAVLGTQIVVIIPDWQAAGKAAVINGTAPFDYWQIPVWLFWTGVFVLTLRMTGQLYSIWKIYRKSETVLLHNHQVRLTTGNDGPFSFMQGIYINPLNLRDEELKAILHHEQVHLDEWHTLDILLAEAGCIFYWFNPCVWLIKNAVRENIEFITDRKVLQQGADTKQYQYSLLNVCLASPSQNIATHFNISTIKKRIIMMNRKKSSNLSLARYILVLPAVIALLLVFTLSKAALKKQFTLKKTPPAKITGQRSGLLPASPKQNLTAKSVTAAPAIDKSKTIKDTIASHKDTVKTILASFTSTGFSSKDSLNYVIDGVTTTLEGAMAMDSTKIESIFILCPAYTNHLMGIAGKKQTVVMITKNNKDAAANVALQDKIQKLDPVTINVQKFSLSKGDNVSWYTLPNHINDISDKPVMAKLLDGSIVKITSKTTN
jgi:bla regulator protein BlaR1